MINTKGKNATVVNNGGTNAPVPLKSALRDVQTENIDTVSEHQAPLVPGGGKSTNGAIKVSGTKRLSSERPSISQGIQSFANNDANENIINVRRRFDQELGRGRLQDNVEKYEKSSELAQMMNQTTDNNIQHVAARTTSNNVMPPPTFPCGGLMPTSSVRNGSGVPVAKVLVEQPRTDYSNVRSDQVRAEHFIRLQKYLRQRDEDKQSEYIQMLLQLSYPDLSKHAVELEKRAIRLVIEEANEVKRMKVLKLLAKISPADNLKQSLQSSKDD